MSDQMTNNNKLKELITTPHIIARSNTEEKSGKIRVKESKLVNCFLQKVGLFTDPLISTKKLDTTFTNGTTDTVTIILGCSLWLNLIELLENTDLK